MDFLGIGGLELLLILIVALLVVGPGKIVEISRTLGKTVNAFKKAASELTTQVTKELEEEKKAASELAAQVNQEIVEGKKPSSNSDKNDMAISGSDNKVK